jgi:hypothetical protein
MAMISMSSSAWQEVIGAIEIADDEGKILHAQQLIDTIKLQLKEQED